MVFIRYNSLKSDMFLIPYLFHAFQDTCFSGSRFFRAQVFQGPGFSGSRIFWVQVFKGPGFSGSRFSRVQVLRVHVFLDPGFFGSRFFRVQVKGPGPGFRSSQMILRAKRAFKVK